MTSILLIVGAGLAALAILVAAGLSARRRAEAELAEARRQAERLLDESRREADFRRLFREPHTAMERAARVAREAAVEGAASVAGAAYSNAGNFMLSPERASTNVLGFLSIRGLT